MGEKIIEVYCAKPRAARSCCCDAGDPIKISAKLSIDPVTGDRIAEPGEKINLNAYIQASKSSCDIVTIVQKLQAGDESVINVRQGFYGDATILPKDINDINNIEKLNQAARSNFDKLPDEVKALFQNDPSKFLEAVLNNTAESAISALVALKKEENGKQVEEKQAKEEEVK